MAIANVSLGATTSATAASKTTITVTPSTAPTNGNSLVVIGSYHVTGTGSFSDNGVPANTYTVQATKTNTIQVDLGTVLSVAGSPTSITYSNTGAKGAIAICVAEYSGVNVFGTTGSNTGSTSPATVAVTTLGDNDWLVGGGTNNSTGTLTAGAGTNNRSTNTTNIDSWIFDSGAVATPASTTLSETLGTPAAWATVGVLLRPPATTSGAGTEKTSRAFVLSQKVAGAGTEKATAALVASQKVSGAGTEKAVGTATSAAVSTSGAGTEKAAATTLLSQKVTGAGTEKTSTAFSLSQKAAGAGTEKTALATVLSQKVTGAGTEKTTTAFALSQKVSGAGTEKTSTAFSLTQKVTGSGTEKSSTALIASQKTSGAGAEKTSTAFVLSQKATSTGTEKAVPTTLVSQKVSGAGTEKTSTAFSLSQKVSGSGSSKATGTASVPVTGPSGSGLSQAIATVSIGGTTVGIFWGPVGPRSPAYGCVWFNSSSGQILYWNGFNWTKPL